MTDSNVSTKYIQMSDPVYSRVSERIKESYPHSCICWIEEAVNPNLKQEYENRKKEMATRGDVNEGQFFHGTSEESINSIIYNGFDPKYNKTWAYGRGTYFAKNASYSFNYMPPNKDGLSFMFLCDVLLGRSCVGKNGLTIDTNKYDSAVDDLVRPTIVVTPYADGAYQRYIVAFHKNAVA